MGVAWVRVIAGSSSEIKDGLISTTPRVTYNDASSPLSEIKHLLTTPNNAYVKRQCCLRHDSGRRGHPNHPQMHGVETRLCGVTSNQQIFALIGKVAYARTRAREKVNSRLLRLLVLVGVVLGGILCGR